MKQKYFSSDDDLIYHYCSADTFLKICSNKTFRFSDILTLNDSMEMEWGYKIWENIRDLDEFEEHPRWQDLQRSISVNKRVFLPLVACFSTQGDILSQWRAYADDGAGFCIGFTKNFASQLPASFCVVEYDLNKQKFLIRDSIKKILAREEPVSLADADVLDFIWQLIGYKNPAFMEEGEVRLVHMLFLDQISQKLESIGGYVNQKAVDGPPLHFKMRNSTPAPFVDLDFHECLAPIKEVILGPKNYSDPDRISIFLNTVGISDVVLKKSVASYR